MTVYPLSEHHSIVRVPEVRSARGDGTRLAELHAPCLADLTAGRSPGQRQLELSRLPASELVGRGSSHQSNPRQLRSTELVHGEGRTSPSCAVRRSRSDSRWGMILARAAALGCNSSLQTSFPVYPAFFLARASVITICKRSTFGFTSIFVSKSSQPSYTTVSCRSET